MAKKTAQIVAVGDAVRLPLTEKNDYAPGQAAVAGSGAGALEGLVCSIRQVATGEFVATAADNLRQYVIEVLVSKTFHPAFASAQNLGPTAVHRVMDNPVWQSVRDRLVDLRNQGQLPAGGPAVLSGPLKDLVDTWGLVRIRAKSLLLLDPTPTGGGSKN